MLFMSRGMTPGCLEGVSEVFSYGGKEQVKEKILKPLKTCTEGNALTLTLSQRERELWKHPLRDYLKRQFSFEIGQRANERTGFLLSQE